MNLKIELDLEIHSTFEMQKLKFGFWKKLRDENKMLREKSLDKIWVMHPTFTLKFCLSSIFSFRWVNLKYAFSSFKMTFLLIWNVPIYFISSPTFYLVYMTWTGSLTSWDYLKYILSSAFTIAAEEES